MSELLEDVAFGDGAEYMIEQGYISPVDIADPVVRDAAEEAVSAFDAWRSAARAFQDAAEAFLAKDA